MIKRAPVPQACPTVPRAQVYNPCPVPPPYRGTARGTRRGTDKPAKRAPKERTSNMIQFEEIDGIYCPVFVCAQCHEPIQEPEHGLIQWDSYDEPTFTVLLQGACRIRSPLALL
jgi:hypothetical protein